MGHSSYQAYLCTQQIPIRGAEWPQLKSDWIGVRILGGKSLLGSHAVQVGAKSLTTIPAADIHTRTRTRNSLRLSIRHK
jgi:hypothetical protein